MGGRIKLDKNRLEKKIRGSYGFPFRYGNVILSKYENSRFELHWHSEPEIILISDGSLEVQTGDKINHLSAGSAIFINGSVLHSGWHNGTGDCSYDSMSFNPVLISGHENSAIEKKYVAPLISSPRFPYCLFDSDLPKNREILSLLRQCSGFAKQQEDGYELLIRSSLTAVWHTLYQRSLEVLNDKGDPVEQRRQDYVKKAVDYINNNYSEVITLDSIASVSCLSRAELCRCFKRMTRMTPFEYIARIRIQKSLPLLIGDEFTIADIATHCGFSNPSYYAEVFRKFMYCSPTEYIKRQKL